MILVCRVKFDSESTFGPAEGKSSNSEIQLTSEGGNCMRSELQKDFPLFQETSQI